MKVGDLVKFTHKGQRELLLGIITSDYSGAKMGNPESYMNVMWIGKVGIRPINIKSLEVISEGR